MRNFSRNIAGRSLSRPRQRSNFRLSRERRLSYAWGMSTPDEQLTTKRRGHRHFLISVRWSLDGFFAALKHEPSFREGLIFALLLVPVAVILPVNAVSTAVMIASLFLIIIAELLNSAVEWTIDDISLEKRLFAKRAKDMGSAAVFLSYLNCIVVWAIILLANWDRIAKLEFLRWPPHFLP